MKESEVVKIIENYTGYVDRSRTDQCLHEVNFNFVAKDITKKLNSMKLSNTEINVLMVALDHMEEEISDLMSERTLRGNMWKERLDACESIRAKIKQL